MCSDDPGNEAEAMEDFDKLALDDILEREAWRLGPIAEDPSEDLLDDPKDRGFLYGLIRIHSHVNDKGQIVDAQGRRRTLYKTAAQVRGEKRGRAKEARRNETPEQAEERKRKNRERMRALRAMRAAQ